MESQNGVGTHGLGVVKHQVVGLLSCLLAHLGIRTDATADDALEPAEDALRNRWGADDNAPDDSEVLLNAIPFEGKRGGYSNTHG